MYSEGDGRSTSLLDAIVEGALDDDYYEVRGGRYSKARSFGTWRTALVLAFFGAVVAIAAIQTQSNRSSVQAQRSVIESSIVAERESLAEKDTVLADIEEQILDLQQAQDARSGELTKQGLVGIYGVEGPGVSVVLRNGAERVSVYEIQQAVNALWGSGAEAVSVNGERITTFSAIATANNVVMVNYQAVSPPYILLAIGADLKPEFELTKTGRYLENLADGGQLNLDVKEYDRLYIGPAPENRVTVKSAGKATAP